MDGRGRLGHRERDEFDFLFWIIVTVAIIGVIMGLIEWNARRQAAAITREMLRPATVEEQREINRQSWPRKSGQPDRWNLCFVGR